jgi:7-carboxy-7-deazaguanine synthase
MKVCEIFKSLQGEGKYVGYPALFIRLSGCTRKCDFCDTKYHVNGKNMSIEDVVKRIKKSKPDIVVWTGGEPMLHENEIYDVITETDEKHHHLETNGDLLPECPGFFKYICFSPKEERVADKVFSFYQQMLSYEPSVFPRRMLTIDIKIVTDLKLNKDIIKYATMLMPLTTGDKEKDLKIQQDVWNYCVNHNIKYAPRIHRDVWGNKKGV